MEDTREEWWRALVDAVAGLQVNNFAAAREYIAIVRQLRGEEQVLLARSNLRRLQLSSAFANCNDWRNNNYEPTPKPPKAPTMKPRA